LTWLLPPTPDGTAPGRLSVRLVRSVGDPHWLYLSAQSEGEPQTRIAGVRVGSYPFTTTGTPDRQRWISSLTGEHLMSDANTPLDAAREWGLVLHNKRAQEEGGALLVFDPEEITGASTGGTYNVAVHMTPHPDCRAVHLALGYFWNTPYARAVTDFRTDAANRLPRLQQVDWTAHVRADDWQKLKGEIEALLAYPAVKAEFGPRWATVSKDADAALAELQRTPNAGCPPSAGADRRFALLRKQARALQAEMYDAAVKALLFEATR
jgi:hypothetical protein